MTAIWTRCPMCDEYMCNIHQEHAADCSCPAIEVWESGGYWPYDDQVTPEVEQWVAENPFEEDES